MKKRVKGSRRIYAGQQRGKKTYAGQRVKRTHKSSADTAQQKKSKIPSALQNVSASIKDIWQPIISFIFLVTQAVSFIVKEFVK